MVNELSAHHVGVRIVLEVIIVFHSQVALAGV